jgi:hypothetical protein
VFFVEKKTCCHDFALAPARENDKVLRQAESGGELCRKILKSQSPSTFTM